jgi:hypothetical protein
MPRERHPSKEIEAAIHFARQHGWQFRVPGRSAHCFGVLMCPHNDKACRCGLFCRVSIWSTPANPQAHARSLRRTVEKCIHEISGDD